MKKLVFILVAALGCLPANAQKARELHEVTVVASRTTNNAEGYTVNLRGADIAKGKPAVDLLGFLPNVSRENGNFKINGLSVSEIYVDGVRLSDLSELEGIPGEMIDCVQVRYLAGADQNASFSGGTIMITLRRPPEGGYYGSIIANADWYRSCGFGNEGIGAMTNYRYKGLSVYDNIYTGATKIKDNAEQTLTGPDLHTMLTETSKSHGFDFRNRLSLTQQFGTGAQLGGSYLVSTSRPRQSTMSTNADSRSLVVNNSNAVLQEGTVCFAQPLGNRGAKLELTADYLNRHSDDNSNYWVGTENVAAATEKYNVDLWKFKADIVYPHSRSLLWKFGASSQIISSSYSPTNIIESDRFAICGVPTKTEGFTPIVYATAQGRLWRLKYSAGLNWQLNRISYEDRAVGRKNINIQWSINPTLQLMMPFGAKMDHALMLSYKRTLNDIPYAAISSVIDWSDAYNYTVGNPDLKAQSSDIVMVGLSLLRNKINLTAIYAHSHDRIYWQTFQSAENADVFYTKPVNINGQGIWGFGAEWVESPARWWRFKLSGRVEINPENIELGGICYNKTRFKEYFYFNNSFSLGHGWGGMLNANFEPTFRSLDRTYHAVYSLGGQVYKTFLNDNLQIAIDLTPIGNRRKLDRRAGDHSVSYKYTTPVQFVGFSLTWNFSGGKDVNVNVVDGIQDYYEIKDDK